MLQVQPPSLLRGSNPQVGWLLCYDRGPYPAGSVGALCADQCALTAARTALEPIPRASQAGYYMERVEDSHLKRREKKDAAVWARDTLAVRAMPRPERFANITRVYKAELWQVRLAPLSLRPRETSKCTLNNLLHALKNALLPVHTTLDAPLAGGAGSCGRGWVRPPGPLVNRPWLVTLGEPSNRSL
jgi:hypothetical protein